jgi:hypothetical protein
MRPLCTLFMAAAAHESVGPAGMSAVRNFVTDSSKTRCMAAAMRRCRSSVDRSLRAEGRTCAERQFHAPVEEL